MAFTLYIKSTCYIELTSLLLHKNTYVIVAISAPRVQ